jgi:RNA polymerase sigma-70 factor (ECF subfamily)
MAKKQGKQDQNAVVPRSGPRPNILRSMSAEELARRSQQGCRASFAELIERYGIQLFKFLRYKTNSLHDAEDLVQDTFIKAYENIHRYRDSWKFSTWLFTIATRLANSHFRRARSFRPLSRIRAEDAEPGQTLVDEETRQNLWALAGDLSTSQYMALWLKYGQDMPIKEIAKVMRKSQVNIKVLLYRARLNLAKRLQNMAVENETADQKSPKEALYLMKVEGA